MKITDDNGREYEIKRIGDLCGEQELIVGWSAGQPKIHHASHVMGHNVLILQDPDEAPFKVGDVITWGTKEQNFEVMQISGETVSMRDVVEGGNEVVRNINDLVDRVEVVRSADDEAAAPAAAENPRWGA